MNNSHRPVPLNPELPFVKAMFDVIEGRRDLEAAIQILKDEEQTYGVCIIYDRNDEYYGIVGDLVPKQGTLNASDMLALARNAEWDKFTESYISPDAAAYDKFQIKLNRFLDATSLVLQGGEFTNNCLITLDDESIWTFSQREWGEYLSDWANQNKWMQKFGNFKYVEFAFYCNEVIKDYLQWAEVAFAAIEQKCSQEFHQS